MIKRILSYSLQSLRQSLTASFFSMIIERATAENDLTVPYANTESGMIFHVLPDET